MMCNNILIKCGEKYVVIHMEGNIHALDEYVLPCVDFSPDMRQNGIGNIARLLTQHD